MAINGVHQGYYRIVEYLKKHNIEAAIDNSNKYVIAKDSKGNGYQIYNMRETFDLIQKGKKKHYKKQSRRRAEHE